MQYSLNILITLSLVTFATIKAAPIPEAVVIQPVQQQIIQPQAQAKAQEQIQTQGHGNFQTGFVEGSEVFVRGLVNGTLNLVSHPIDTIGDVAKGTYQTAKSVVLHPIDTGKAVEHRVERCFNNGTEAGYCAAQTIENVALGYVAGPAISRVGSGAKSLAISAEGKALSAAPKALKWRTVVPQGEAGATGGAAGATGAAGAAGVGGSETIEAAGTQGVAGSLAEKETTIEGVAPKGTTPAAESRTDTATTAADKPAEPTKPKEEAGADKTKDKTAPADKPAEEKATADKPAQETATADKPAEETATADKPAEETATADKPAEETATADKPAEETATADKPAEETATADKPSEETATENEQAIDTSAQKTPSRFENARNRISNAASSTTQSIKDTAAKIPVPESVKKAAASTSNFVKTESTVPNAALVGGVGSTTDSMARNAPNEQN